MKRTRYSVEGVVVGDRAGDGPPGYHVGIGGHVLDGIPVYGLRVGIDDK
jgi:hypothetical protein